MMKLFLALVLPLALAATSPVQRESPSMVFELPGPTGPAPVGTTRWVVTDASRRETFASGNAPRQVPVVAWYPVASPPTEQPAPYFREGLVEIRSFARLLGQPATAFDELSSVRTHAALDAPPAASPAKLPVLIFSHGYTGVASAHAALLEDLASHGFVVLSVNHSYESTGAVLDGGRDVSVVDDTGQMRREIRNLAALYEQLIRTPANGFPFRLPTPTVVNTDTSVDALQVPGFPDQNSFHNGVVRRSASAQSASADAP
jgi:predicted dienelactone hydrolase